MRVGKDVRFSTVPEWLVFHQEVSAFAVRVWAVLDRKADTESGQVEISITAIAKFAKCAVNTVKKSITELEAAGALEVERCRTSDAGDYDTNSYILRTSDPSSRDGGGSPRDLPGGSPFDPQVGHLVTQGVGHHMATKEESLKNENPKESSKGSLDSPIIRQRIPGGLVVPFAERVFEEFWSAYPNKKAKGAARVAWAKRMKSGTDPEALVAGARRFSAWVVEALRVGEIEAMKFVPHPATWINGEREQDYLTVPGKPMTGGIVDRARAAHEKRFGHAS